MMAMGHPKAPAAASWCCLLFLLAVSCGCRLALATGRGALAADTQVSSYERDYHQEHDYHHERDYNDCLDDGHLCSRAKQCCSGTCLRHTCWSDQHQRPPCRQHHERCLDSEDCCGTLLCRHAHGHLHLICRRWTCTPFSYTGGWQHFRVPAGVTSITIDAYGAQGGSVQPGFKGGKGARMSGAFAVSPGDRLIILVGGQGQVFTFTISGLLRASAGGGGGTFVVREDLTSADVITGGPFSETSVTPLVIAGGGGGIRFDAEQDGCPGQPGQYATTGSGANPSGGCAVKSTGLGLGGNASSPTRSYGSGGGGFRGNGTGDTDISTGVIVVGTGGRAFLSGGAGGVITTACIGATVTLGGLGGGGGGGCIGGGGGGGFSGGDGGLIAGGGGSFNAGSNQLNTIGARSGDGTVRICYF